MRQTTIDRDLKLNLVRNGIFPLKGVHKEDSTGYNITGTYQGEGKLTGTPCIFIRTSGCNLRCFALEDENDKGPMVVMGDKTEKPMMDLKEGDEVIARRFIDRDIRDEDDPEYLVTQVRGVRIDGDVEELIELDIEGYGKVKVTPEHPFRASLDPRDTGIWIQAKSLTEYHYIISNQSTALSVESTRTIQLDSPVRTINIQTDMEHYMVSNEGYWLSTHNCAWVGADGSGSPCDTPYSSHNPEKNKRTVGEILDVVKESLEGTGINYVVVSGGEPTLQKKPLGQLLKGLREMGLHTTIETNGTIFDEVVAENTELVSMSPKLSTSTPWEENLKNTGIDFNEKWAERHERDRVNVEAIQSYIDHSIKNGTEFQLKFVVSRPEDFDEIENDFLSKLNNFKNDDVCIMPEGWTRKDLNQRTKWASKMALERGYRFTPRLHILLYGTNRYV